MHIQDIQDASIEQLEEIERTAYNSGDTVLTAIVQKCIQLQNEVQALENQIEDTETLDAWEKKNGPAYEYVQFFNTCFDRLPAHYPCPSVTSEHDKSVIFEAIEGEPLRDALYKALPFVEDTETSQDFKPGVVTKIIKEIRQALGE